VEAQSYHSSNISEFYLTVYNNSTRTLTTELGKFYTENKDLTYLLTYLYDVISPSDYVRNTIITVNS